MNCESWEEPKNSLTAATIGLIETRSCGLIVSFSFIDIRSLAIRSMRLKAVLSEFERSSPTDRIRRFPRWSMSSTFASPMYTLIRYRIVLTMQSLVRTKSSVGSS